MPLMGWQIGCVAVAGALGALARWGLTLLVARLAGTSWPWGTLVVNVLGCLVFGVAWAWTRHLPTEPGWVRLFWLTGFAGAFTTFSTLAFDLYRLDDERGLLWAALNLALHLGLGLAALVAGLALGRAL